MLHTARLLTPGPTPLPERVRLAMARNMIHHRKPEFKEMMAETQKGLKTLFGTEGTVLTLASSGTGGMTAAVANLFAAGEKVLVVEGGKFAERWTAICKVYGVETEILKVEWGKGVNPADIAKALDADKSIRGVLMQMSETSTGVQHNVEGAARVTSGRDVLLVVDGISGVSIAPCPMDLWGIDCLVTGSQKGLMLPPGLAFIALSERAWKKAESLPDRNFYFNLCKEREQQTKGQTAWTTPVSLVAGLAESLRMFAEAGFETVYRKQWALTMMTRTGLAAMGMQLFAEKDFAWGVTATLLPEGVDSVKLLQIAASRFGVIMAAGQDHLKNRMVRVGHMGWLDFGDITVGLHAFAESFRTCGGHIGCRDYLEQALDAYWKAFEAGCPKP